MNPELAKKTLTQLRTMAQAFGVTDIFEKDEAHLIQAIETKQLAMQPAPISLPPRDPHDARLMTERPNKICSPLEITEALRAHIQMGLKLSFQPEYWSMACGRKTDTGSLRMSLRDILGCADRVLR